MAELSNCDVSVVVDAADITHLMKSGTTTVSDESDGVTVTVKVRCHENLVFEVVNPGEEE